MLVHFIVGEWQNYYITKLTDTHCNIIGTTLLVGYGQIAIHTYEIILVIDGQVLPPVAGV